MEGTHHTGGVQLWRGQKYRSDSAEFLFVMENVQAARQVRNLKKSWIFEGR